MTVRLEERGIRVVVLDIEGTTTPIAFVHDVLFPYARRALRAYVGSRLDAPELRDVFERLREEWLQDRARGENPPAWREGTREARAESVVGYAEWLMDRDRKAPGLKALQGHIWAAGYQDGTLRGDVFEDVPDAFARWRAQGITIAIFSSGSVLAQQLLFRHTAFGDLTALIHAHFDTGVGPKNSPDSYSRIAAALGSPADRLLFVSDVPAELAAARAAGCVALLCVRPGNPPVSGSEREQAVREFSEIQ